MIRKFLRDEDGTAAIEYALLGALIAIGGILAFDALGTALGSLFGGVSAKVDTVRPK
ncbi:MAG: Flp family type IVb pilin [Rhodospirillaceae bacterium]|nr:Flp family type IVb pilin [Rhodospirillaceae bacterium]